MKLFTYIMQKSTPDVYADERRTSVTKNRTE